MTTEDYRQSLKTAARLQADIDLMRLAYRDKPERNHRRRCSPVQLMSYLLPCAAALGVLALILTLIFR